MLTRSPEQLKDDAEKLLSVIEETAGDCPAGRRIVAAVEETEDVVGGGSAPATVLKGYCVSVVCSGIYSQELERKLRTDALPIVTRINHDKVLFDVRTIAEEEYQVIADRLKKITEEK